MSEGIICALIAGLINIIGIVASNISSNKKIENQLDKQQAIMNTKLESLTNAVNEHNNFARRMPVVEEKISVINHRLDDLEKKVG